MLRIRSVPTGKINSTNKLKSHKLKTNKVNNRKRKLSPLSPIKMLPCTNKPDKMKVRSSTELQHTIVSMQLLIYMGLVIVMSYNVIFV